MKFIVKTSNKQAGAPCKQATKSTMKVKQVVLTRGGRDKKEIDVEVEVWTVDVKYANELVDLVRENSTLMLSVGNEGDVPEIIFTGA